MDQLLSIGWWFSSFGQVWLWWLACVMLGVLAYPLTLKLFRGCAEGGAALSTGVGLIVVTLWAYYAGFGYWGFQGSGFRTRALLLLVAAGWLIASFWWTKDRGGITVPYLVVPGMLALAGLLYLPHSMFSILVATLLLGAASIGAWWGDLGGLRRAAVVRLVPFLVGQVLFTVAFLFFANVRSYLPWASFDSGMWAAEKFGNLTHLNSILQSGTMPPSDAWFLGRPINYYYGGHLMVATLAKLTGTEARFAFNFGLATVFALTMSMGFALAFNAVHGIARRSTMVAKLAGVRLVWHHGMLWGLFGAAAIGLFGNLDAVQQVLTRDPQAIRNRIAYGLDMERDALIQRHTQDRVAAFGKPDVADLEARLAQELEALSDAQKPMRAALNAMTPTELRLSAANLALMDFWRSSRAIKGTPAGERNEGTITEFPYFSAILGDLHPHHSALPVTMGALCALIALLRRNRRAFAANDAAWWQRSSTALLAMGLFIGFVFMVNIWDAVVLVPLYLLAVLIARRFVPASEWWKWVGYLGMIVVLTWLVALVANSRPGTVPMFGSGRALLLAALVCAAIPGLMSLLWPKAPAAAALGVPLAAGAGIIAVGGFLAHGTYAPLLAAPPGVLDVALRDAGWFLALAGIAAMWTLRAKPGGGLWWYSAGGFYAVAGITALLICFPFKAIFVTPLETQGRLLVSALPPIPDPAFLTGPGSIWDRFWAASPINPFPMNLRTEMRDYIVHWGQFAIPVVAFFAWRLAALRRRCVPGQFFAFHMLLVAIVSLSFVFLRYWTGAFAIALAVGALVMAFAFKDRDEGPAWAFAATAFFWSWFVEALHFDDTYSGYLERYNTPFKIFYPVWPMFAIAMVVALREMGARSAVRARGFDDAITSPAMSAYGALLVLVLWSMGVSIWLGVVLAVIAWLMLRGLGNVAESMRPGGRDRLGLRVARAMAHTPAMVLVAVVTFLGMLYPIGATMNRTREFGTEPLAAWQRDPNGEYAQAYFTERTLDSLAWFEQRRTTRGDLPGVEWLIANAPAGSRVLERPSEHAYEYAGRVSAMTGLNGTLGWAHHQKQWRGWNKVIPEDLQAAFIEEFLDELPPLKPPLAKIQPAIEVNPETQKRLYRLSVRPSPEELRKALRELAPEASEADVRAMAGEVHRAREEKLRMGDFHAKLINMRNQVWRAAQVSDRVQAILKMLEIDYVFVGKLERDTYGPAELAKFAANPNLFELVFGAHAGPVAIYRVKREALK